ncbi:hypothetical protein KEM54_002059, partial [Ascosphaera aggregata]
TATTTTATTITKQPSRVSSIESRLRGLESRLHSSSSSIDARLNSFSTAIDQPSRVNSIESRLSDIENRLHSSSTSIDARFSSINARLGSTDSRLSDIESRLHSISTSIDARFSSISTSIDARFNSIDARLDKIGTSNNIDKGPWWVGLCILVIFFACYMANYYTNKSRLRQKEEIVKNLSTTADTTSVSVDDIHLRKGSGGGYRGRQPPSLFQTSHRESHPSPPKITNSNSRRSHPNLDLPRLSTAAETYDSIRRSLRPTSPVKNLTTSTYHTTRSQSPTKLNPPLLGDHHVSNPSASGQFAPYDSTIESSARQARVKENVSPSRTSYTKSTLKDLNHIPPSSPPSSSHQRLPRDKDYDEAWLRRRMNRGSVGSNSSEHPDFMPSLHAHTQTHSHSHSHARARAPPSPTKVLSEYADFRFPLTSSVPLSSQDKETQHTGGDHKAATATATATAGTSRNSKNVKFDHQAEIHNTRRAATRELPTHSRSQTVDLALRLSSTSKMFTDFPPELPSPTRDKHSTPFPSSPDSNQLANRKSFSHHAPSHSQPNVFSTTLTAPELQKFQKSSVNHLRTLSDIANSRDKDLLSMPSVANLQRSHQHHHNHGQLKSGNSTIPLEARESSPTKQAGITAWTANKLMDKQRQFLQAYEYLCHIGEAKEWIEDVIRQPLPAIVQLEEALRNGITLAEIVQVFYPDQPLKIFRHPKLQYRHTDNIALFFQFLDAVELPEVFRFEMIDLYDKKNIPKVIYCIHALSWLLYKNGVVEFRIGNLVGQLEFQTDELEQMQKGLDKSGVTMPSFSGVGATFGAEPEETEQEKVDRQLHEMEEMIADFQAQVRGALERLRLGELMETLWENEPMIIHLQSIIRGQVVRESLGSSMYDIAAALQPMCRGFLVRRQAPQMDNLRQSLEPQVAMLQNLIRGHKARTQFQHVQRRVKAQEKTVAKLQAAIRGAFVRGEVMDRYEETQAATDGVIQLQAVMRAALARKKMAQSFVELRQVEPQVCKLQALLKGAMQRRAAAEKQTSMLRVETPICSFQAAIKGFLVRRTVEQQHAQIQDTETGMTLHRLQAAIKGFLVRRNNRGRTTELKQQAQIIEKLQSFVRGSFLRQKLARQHALSLDSEEQLIHLQALSRAMNLRRKLSATSRFLQEHTPTVISLQSLVRGNLIRSSLKTQSSVLDEFKSDWTGLQSFTRGYLERMSLATYQAELESCNDSWVALQSLIRANQSRGIIDDIRAMLQDESACVIDLQSSIRGALQRDWVDDTLSALEENQDSIVMFQSLARGKLWLQKVGADHQDLLAEEDQVIKFQALGRGALQRVTLVDLFEQLDACLSEIEALQALARGRNLRFSVGHDLMDIEAEEEYILELQSWMRGHLVRENFAAKEKHYRENMEKVVKVQSLFRAKVQGEAYRSLTSGKNPPVGTVKGFVHLLNDSDFDFNEEIEFERVRKTVVQQIRQNEIADEHISELDTKIALLVQNKITLDEVIKRQKHFGGHIGTLITNADKDPFDLKAINKNSRRRLEQFQELFFFLQTQPQYVARLFIALQQQGISEKDAEGIKHATMRLFGYAQKRREEYHLVRLIVRSVREEIEASPSLAAYERQGQSLWNKVFGVYRNAPKDRQFIGNVLGELVKRYIIEASLDLESSPLRIYRFLINEEELRTGKRSRRDPNVSEQQAAQDPETKAVFVRNLQDLRDIADYFIASLESRLHQMPFSVRFIARQMYEALVKHFPNENKGLLLKATGKWIWRSYFRPAVLEPEKHNAADHGLTQEQKRNLNIVARVIGHVATATEFGGDTRYLVPLNPWLANSAQHLASIWARVIQVQDAEGYFDIDEFNDLYAKQKPTLYIKMSDISFINRTVCANIDAICPDPHDVLRDLVNELQNEKHEAELMRYSSTEIYLTLTPKLHKIDDSETDARTLMIETKRCILYIIRVQTGANLLDIMLRQPTIEDEKKWRKLVHDELSANSCQRGAYADSGASLADIGRLSYQELKATALEHILLLEQRGKVTRNNNYQDILNAIAIDIRTKHRRRLQRQKELEGAKLTLTRLNDQAAYLQSQMKTYDTYIEQAMITLQNKKGKKRFLMPFTKQWDHQRELAKLGREVKFGSYKYSARNLANRGVLVYWKGYSERDWDRVDLTISSNEVGVFMLEGTTGNMVVPKASAQLPLDDLLQAQYNNNQFMDLFEGQLRVNVNLFLHLIMKKFYN